MPAAAVSSQDEVFIQAPDAGNASAESYDRVLIAGSFRFFFNARSGKTSPADMTDTRGDGVPDYVRTHLQQLISAHQVYVEQMGLPDFFKTGILFQQGLRYLDVVLDDIPVQKGLASNKVAETTPVFLKDGSHEGMSVRLRLHRALPFNSLTPAHELFHVFQYAHLPILNMWFMEGLARHAQSWCGFGKPKTEALPRTKEQLETLLRRWHDAEFFWNRIATLCVSAEANAEDRSVVGEYSIGHNHHLIRQTFLKYFFPCCAHQLKLMCSDMPHRDLPASGLWPNSQMRSGANNRYILRAICDAAKACGAPSHPELDGFLWLIAYLDGEYRNLERSPQVQAFLGTLKMHDLAEVRATHDGSLQCDVFDPVFGCLSVPEVVFAPDTLSNAQLDSFIVVRHVIGHVRLQHQSELSDLHGLSELRAIEGDLSISGTGLDLVHEACPHLERIKGNCQIVGNNYLKHFHGFHKLSSIDGALEISNHPQLLSLNGFRNLEEIKKGTLKLQTCLQLNKVAGFQALQRARGIEITNLAIQNLDFLAHLIASSPQFPGSIKITRCRISHLHGLIGLQTVASSLYLHNNELKNVDALTRLREVGASLSLGSNQLENIQGLSGLISIGGMLSLHSNCLQELSGLASLRSVKTTLWNKVARTIDIYGNPELTDIRGLSGVSAEDGCLILHCDDVSQYQFQPDINSPFNRNILQIHQVKK